MSKTKKPKADYRYFVKSGREVVKKRVYGECTYLGEKRLYTKPDQIEPRYHNSQAAKLFFKKPEAAVKALNRILTRRVDRIYRNYVSICEERDKLVRRAADKFFVTPPVN